MTVTNRNGVSMSFPNGQPVAGRISIEPFLDPQAPQSNTFLADSVGNVYTTTASSDYSGCTGSLPIGAATTVSLSNGDASNRLMMKLCYVQIPIQTAFGSCTQYANGLPPNYCEYSTGTAGLYRDGFKASYTLRMVGLGMQATHGLLHTGEPTAVLVITLTTEY